ncbi:MAG: hypothetical protein ACO3NK_02115 [Prochlorotrichaceae cyanobacterium]
MPVKLRLKGYNSISSERLDGVIMSFLNLTIGQVFSKVSKQFRRNEIDYFELPDLSPWKGRRAQVYPIIAACWRVGIHKYPAIQAQVKAETGIACSRALIADWKREYLSQNPYAIKSPLSPRTGSEEPKKPYQTKVEGIFREGVSVEW